LYEAGLLHKEKPVIDLTGADLSAIDLHNKNLSGSGAFLRDFSLYQALKLKIEPGKAANLRGAILSDANMERAMLEYTNLSHVYLNQADLGLADLSDADLSDASGITNEELEQQAASLERATMPDGQKYEDWLKDKKTQGKDEKNE